MNSVISLNDNILELLKKHNVSDLVQEILLSQHLEYAQIEQILEDQKYELQSDALDNIINRIYKAKAMQEKIVIVGDYDADGIMATTILHKAFTAFELEVGFYIPDRLKEGYGLNKNIVKNVHAKGYGLIITVDNGVVAYDALDYAKELGLEVIVTDHHHLDESVNYNYDYLLHPKLLSPGYNDLCGAGVALVIAEKLLNKKNVGELYVYAMIATIADMVSVFGFNRNIIKNGLYYLNKFGNKHVEKLIHYRNGVIDQQVISFQVVPKLNTFGRLADQVNVNNMVRYFLLESDQEIDDVSKEIAKLNRERIDMTRKTFENCTNINKYGTLNVLIDENIHEGITGLIAGRHLKDLLEPVVVLTHVGDLYKGSGRSPKGYDIHALLDPISSEFTSFGGHKQACGLSFEADRLDYILELITENSKDLVIEAVEDPYLTVDVDALTIEAVQSFQQLEPYGVDFNKPLLKVDLDITTPPTVLKEKYLKWRLSPAMEMLCFNSGLDLDQYKQREHLEAFIDLSLNTFRDKTTINLIVDEFI